MGAVYWMSLDQHELVLILYQYVVVYVCLSISKFTLQSTFLKITQVGRASEDDNA